MIRDFFDRLVMIGGNQVQSKHRLLHNSSSAQNLLPLQSQSGFATNSALGYKNSLANLHVGKVPQQSQTALSQTVQPNFPISQTPMSQIVPNQLNN